MDGFVIKQITVQVDRMEINISAQIQQIEKLLEQVIPNKSDLKQAGNQQAVEDSNRIGLTGSLEPVLKVVLNSLKLNSKLYNSLTQKQSQIQHQTTSFLYLSNQTEHKIHEALKRTKQLYQQTVHQNQKSRFLLEQFITPIRQQLKSKVDETTFSLQMKMLLDEYDHIGHQITYDLTEEQKVKQVKKKVIQSETLSFLKNQILPVLSQLQNQLQSQSDKHSSIESKIDEITLRIKSLQSQFSFQFQNVQQLQAKIMQVVNQKIQNLNVEKRVTQLTKYLLSQKEKKILSQVQKSLQFSKNLQSNFYQQISKLKYDFTQKIDSQKIQSNEFHSLLQKQKEQLKIQQEVIAKNQFQLENLNKKTNKFDHDIQVFNIVNKKFETLSTKLQNGQFKAKYHQLSSEQIGGLMTKLHEFQVESKKLKKFQKQAQEKALILRGQLKGIRDLLSKKANFSDILMHMQNKVDRQEFKEVKAAIEKLKQLRVQSLKSPQFSRESQDESSTRKKNIRNRSFFSPSLKKPVSLELEPQEVKRFKLGFTSELFAHPESSRKQHSKAFQLRQSIRENNSHIFKPVIQE